MDLTNPREFFYSAVTSAIQKLGMSVRDWTEFYLVEILAKKAMTPQGITNAPLVSQLITAQESKTEGETFANYRRLGDSALFLLGFFSAYLERKGLTRSYVTAIGKLAYQEAADLSPSGFDRVYYDLSDGFDEFAEILDEVRESTLVRTPQDVVKLYDRWKKTKSPAVALKLRKEGVILFTPKK